MSARRFLIELDAQARVHRLLEEAGVTEEAARVSQQYHQESERYWRIVNAGDQPTRDDVNRYRAAFDAYWHVYQEKAGVFGDAP